MLQSRRSIVGATVLVALLWSTSAQAQIGPQVGGPGQPREPGGLVNNLLTGVEYDILNQAKAEKRLQHVQEKLGRDAAHCNSAAVERDAYRIDNLRYRIVVDEWLIRQNSLLDPGCYPYPSRLDPTSCAAIASAARPAQFMYPPQMAPPSRSMAATPSAPITIVNAEPTGPGVAFTVDGVAHQALGGSRQDLAVTPASSLAYDGGGSLGRRKYQVSPGLYEFRSTAEGWALYKVAARP